MGSFPSFAHLGPGQGPFVVDIDKLLPPGYDQEGNGWTAWTFQPPTFKTHRDDVIEVWWPQLANETHHARVGELQAYPEWNVAGVWWRAA